MHGGVIGRAGVGGDEDVVVEVEGVAHRAVDAALGGEAADHQGVDAEAAQDRIEVGAVEARVAQLAHHRLARPRPRSDEGRTRRTRPAEAVLGVGVAAAPARALGPGRRVLRRRSHQPDEHHRRAGRAGRRGQPLGRRQRRGHGAEVQTRGAQRALGRGEVGLHVDDDQRGAPRRDPGREAVRRPGLGGHGVHAWAIRRPGRMSAPNIFRPST